MKLRATILGLGALAVMAVSHGATPPRAMRELPMELFRDRLRGGWAGQMIGVSYGSVYEFQSLNRPITGPLREWKPEFIENSINQDDIYVEMTFLKTLERHGPRANRTQAGIDFRDSKYRLWHANDAARTNLRAGIMPPRSGHPRYNPHADDIDFQIEADIFGLLTPGMPSAAERMCDVFGSIMNYGDGLYGGRFVAGMYSRAYLEESPTPQAIRRCIEAGLASIPAKSEYARVIRDVIDGHQENPGDWLKTWQRVQDRWGEDDLCPEGYRRPFNIDAKLNGAYIALGLLYGEADFGKTLEITTRCGQDADCNPSNAAGILGCLYGYSRIPDIYSKGIPALTGRKFEYTEYDYPALIAACERVILAVLADNGGRLSMQNGREVMEIPAQEPRAPSKVEQMDAFPMDQLLKWRAEYEQRRIRLTLPSEWNGWRIAASGTDMEPGVRAFLNRPNVLVIHPVSETRPAAIERFVRLPAKNARLLLTVASLPERPEADWELRVLADGKVVHSRVIKSGAQWQDVEVDLSPLAGKRVRLRVENAAGGERRWSWEAAYIARAEISGEG